MTKIIWCGGELVALLGLPCVRLCEGTNPKCDNVGWLKLFFKNVRWENFASLAWLECRQTGLGLYRFAAKWSTGLRSTVS